MVGEADALQSALRVADALERRLIPHAIGGALAFGMWSVPRMTLDIDINVFVDASGLDEVFAALREVGAEVDGTGARAAAERDGMFVSQLDGFRLDVFVPSIDFSWEAARTRVRLETAAGVGWFLSAEAIAVFKLLFFRGKDVVDLERLVAVQGEQLDHAAVRAHIVDMLGEADERVRKWDELVAAFSRPAR